MGEMKFFGEDCYYERCGWNKDILVLYRNVFFLWFLYDCKFVWYFLWSVKIILYVVIEFWESFFLVKIGS